VPLTFIVGGILCEKCSALLRDQEQAVNSTPSTLQMPLRNLDLIVEDLGGEAVLTNADASVIHHLNPTAFFIWQACDGSHTIADIASATAAEFNAPDHIDVSADVRQTLLQFAEKGLIVN
jgi:hypothetical protein